MSTRAIDEFFARADSDAALQEELRVVLQGHEETPVGELTALAKKHGFDFSVKELHEALERARELGLGGELTERELEEVAGGTTLQSLTRLILPAPGDDDGTPEGAMYAAPPPGPTAMYMAPPPGPTTMYAAPAPSD